MPIDPNTGLEADPAPVPDQPSPANPDVPADPTPAPVVDPAVDPAPTPTPAARVPIGEILAAKKADIEAARKAAEDAARANEVLDAAIKKDEASNKATASVLEQSKDGVLLPAGDGRFELWQDAGNAAGFVVTHPDNADLLVDAPGQ